MTWFILILAGLFEMFGVNAINRYLKDKTLANALWLIGLFSLSFIMLSYAVNRLPMSTAYAVWTGIGAVGGAVLGILFQGESRAPKRLFFIFLIILATIGLKIAA